MVPSASAWDKNEKLMLPEDVDISTTSLLGSVPDTWYSAAAAELTAGAAEQQLGPAAVLGTQDQLQRAAISISPRGPLLQVQPGCVRHELLCMPTSV